MQWRVDTEVLPDNTIHNWPVSEENEHVLHGIDCECIPRVRRYRTGRIYVRHKSFKVFASRNKVKLGE